MTVNIIDDLLEGHVLLELHGKTALGNADWEVEILAVGIPTELKQLAETPRN